MFIILSYNDSAPFFWISKKSKILTVFTMQSRVGIFESASALAKLQHPQIVRMYGAIQVRMRDPESKSLDPQD
jgi:hypothetical protein